MLGFKVFNTVVMDGSSKFECREIAGIIDMVTNRRFGKSKARSLDKDHPTMKVIKRFTTAERYRQAKLIIEKTYPGNCVYDARL